MEGVKGCVIYFKCESFLSYGVYRRRLTAEITSQSLRFCVLGRNRIM